MQRPMSGLLSLCVVVVIVISVGQIPVYVSGSEVILEEFTSTSGQTFEGNVALLFVPTALTSLTPASWHSYSFGLSGCHSSILLPSGSYIQAKRP